MKHIKLYEGFGYKWKNIYEEDGNLYINLYKLADEIQFDAINNKYDLVKIESDYYDLVRKLLIGKVITFYSEEYGVITNICDKIEFYAGFGKIEGRFKLGFIEIKTENIEDSDNIDDDKVIIHLNIEPDLFRSTQKYNL